MTELRRVTRALLSVSDKTGLVEFARALAGHGIALISTGGTAKLLILSQVVLSLQLSFAVFPLVMFTSDKRKMGEFVNAWATKAAAWTVAVCIAGLNVWLLYLTFSS